MAKRLTDTGKWDKAWFMALPPRIKCLWQYINDKCDQAGVWEMNFSLASIYINEKVTEEDLHHFGDRVEKFRPGKLWIVDHVDFQCGTLRQTCPAHKPVYKLLTKYSLLDRVLNRVYNTQQEIDIEIEEEKEIEKEKEEESEVEKSFFIKHEFEENFLAAFDPITCERYKTVFGHLDLEAEMKAFRIKCDNDPASYHTRDAPGLRNAFQYQLQHSKNKINGISKKTADVNARREAFAKRHSAGPTG